MKLKMMILAAIGVLLLPYLVSAALSPGDLFITGYNCDADAKDFAFIVLTDVADSETIYFTDKGWTSGGALYGGEGIIEYHPPAGGLIEGTVVHVTNTVSLGSTGADLGTATKSDTFTPAVAGDQILVYQGSVASPLFITALSWDSSDWLGGDSTEKSLVPPGLVEGVTALHTHKNLGCGYVDMDNGACVNTLTGLVQDIRFALRQSSAWCFDEDSAFTLSSEDAVITVPFAFQGFEGDGGDTWAIESGANISGDVGTGDAPSNQRIRSGCYSHQTSNSVVNLVLAEISTVDQCDMTLTLHFSSTAIGSYGADHDDTIQVFVALNGAAFPTTADIAVEGCSNARWSYSDIAMSTTAGTPVAYTLASGGDRDDDGDGYSTLRISIPDGTRSLRLNVRTTNDRDDEIWNVDDISLLSAHSPYGTIMVVK